MVLDHVEGSKLADVVGSLAIQSTPIIPKRLDGTLTAAAGDGGAREGRRAPPWCAGPSGTSARTQLRRNSGPVARPEGKPLHHGLAMPVSLS